MIEPTIICPSCSTEIKVTESLAAPLIKATRKEYEARIAEKEADVSKREATLHDQQKEVADARKSIDQQVIEKLNIERKSIAVEEAKKAKTAVAYMYNGLGQRVQKTRSDQTAQEVSEEGDLTQFHYDLGVS